MTRKTPSSDRLKRESKLWTYNGSNRPSFAKKPRDGQESVWDYTRPPFVEEMSQHVALYVSDKKIAETNRPVRVCETASPPCYYIKPSDFIDGEVVKVVGPSSYCEWKGKAVYWNLHIFNRVLENFAWSYPEPNSEYMMLKGLLGIYPNRIDRCELNGEKVLPQPGGFYAGWVTQNIVGPFKGEPGTQGW